MDKDILNGIGLTEPQANAYIYLVESGLSTPAEIAKGIGESRPNTYAILERLEKFGLSRREEVDKIWHFSATHPANLENFVERRRNVILNWEYKLNGLLPSLTRRYYETSEYPDVQFFQGIDGIKRVYEDLLRSKSDLYIIVTPNQHDFLGKDYLRSFIKKRVKAGIKVHALTPRKSGHEYHNTRNDKAHLIDRTFYSAEQFDVPVEINIFDNQVVFVSYGEEVTATVVHSPQITKAMRELFNMIKLASKVSK